jgi:hypothetical protein
MNDILVEKLTQKVINLTEEVNDVNIQVRRLSPPQEVVNRIHERLDAIHAAIGHIEQRLESDNRKLAQLQEQDDLIRQEAENRVEKLNLRLREEADERRLSLERRLNEEADRRERNLEFRLKQLETSLFNLGEELRMAKEQTATTNQSLKEDLLVRIGDHKLGLLVAGVLGLVLLGVLIFR